MFQDFSSELWNYSIFPAPLLIPSLPSNQTCSKIKTPGYSLAAKEAGGALSVISPPLLCKLDMDSTSGAQADALSNTHAEEGG